MSVVCSDSDGFSGFACLLNPESAGQNLWNIYNVMHVPSWHPNPFRMPVFAEMTILTYIDAGAMIASAAHKKPGQERAQPGNIGHDGQDHQGN